MGDRFVLDQGFAVAFLGWQFDVRPPQGLTFDAPVAPVRGVVRASYVEDGGGPRYTGFGVQYCARDAAQPEAALTFRTTIDGPADTLPRSAWQFVQGGCAVQLPGGFKPGLYEGGVRSRRLPGCRARLAAIRDFASYLKFGAEGVTALRERPALVRRALGFGYSQSGRLLREFVRDGFNQDEHGRAAFDGLMIASAGAGGGSFNHRFAMPGQAGNSVLSILRPVDLPPFTDAGCSPAPDRTALVPRIFYTFSSTEYWARAGSLTHTTDDGKADLPPDPSSRLYFLAGTPHASGPLPPLRETGSQQYRHELNFGEPALGAARAAARSRRLGAHGHGASLLALPHDCARRARAARQRHLPPRSVDAVPGIPAAGLAHGFRERLRGHARHHARTAHAGRAVSRAGAAGQRRRQRHRRHPAARSGGASRHAHRVEP
jgi:hypothetical protein